MSSHVLISIIKFNQHKNRSTNEKVKAIIEIKINNPSNTFTDIVKETLIEHKKEQNNLNNEKQYRELNHIIHGANNDIKEVELVTTLLKAHLNVNIEPASVKRITKKNKKQKSYTHKI